jgi:hypothetical protein
MKTLHLILLFLFLSPVLEAQKTEGQCPCCSQEYRQFDFWLGDWEAYVKDKLAGTNLIISIQDSCVIQESWISAGGTYSGTSYNYFNRNSGKWHQLWLDNQGSLLKLSGGMEGNQMILLSDEITDQKGQKLKNRISWTPMVDGSVRQHWETTIDGGAHWDTVFDGLYKRKK